MKEGIFVKLWCFICHEYFDGDVRRFIIKDGHNYCGSCVKYLQDNGLWKEANSVVVQ